MGTVYRCEACGAVFSRPAVVRRRERMPDGIWERQVYWVCPCCGAAETSFESPCRTGGTWAAPLFGGWN